MHFIIFWSSLFLFDLQPVQFLCNFRCLCTVLQGKRCDRSGVFGINKSVIVIVALMLSKAYSSEAKWLSGLSTTASSLVCHVGISFYCSNIIGLLFAIADFPWVFTAGLGHLPLAHHHFTLHLLHHKVLVTDLDGHEYLRDTLNQEEDAASSYRLFEGNRGATSDSQETSCYESGHDRIQWVILLSVID